MSTVHVNLKPQDQPAGTVGVINAPLPLSPGLVAMDAWCRARGCYTDVRFCNVRELAAWEAAAIAVRAL